MPIAIHPPVKGLVHGQVPYESNPVMGGRENLQQLQIICHLGNGHRYERCPLPRLQMI